MGVHHGTEAKEERSRIVRTGTGLGVELDRETGLPNDVEALHGPIVGVDVATSTSEPCWFETGGEVAPVGWAASMPSLG